MPPTSYSWSSLVALAKDAAAQLPPLPTYNDLACGDPASWFRELGYTFWNQELLDVLAEQLQALPAARRLEVAAGTGRWAAELARRGVEVAATDVYSQAPEQARGSQRVIEYGDWVARLSAAEAVEALQPDALLCAWPPLGTCLVPDLLAQPASIRIVVAIGEPGGASELPDRAELLPAGWSLQHWPECERYLVGFNDPPGTRPGHSFSRLLVYRRD